MVAVESVLASTVTLPGRIRLPPPWATAPPCGPPAAIAAPSPTCAPPIRASATVFVLAVWFAVTVMLPPMVLGVSAARTWAVVVFEVAVSAIAAAKLPELFAPASAVVVVM